jgi:hypothetical protein
MTKPSSVLFLSGASLLAFALASGCGSDKCEDTDSCGSFPQAGSTAAGRGGSSAGHSGTSNGGSTAGSSAKGGTGGRGGSSNAGESGQAGGGESGTGPAAGHGGESGQAGIGAAAGAGGSDPCDGACSGATPICKADTGDCVECTKSSHCGGSSPVCDTESNSCVQCSADDSSACDGETPVCDTGSSQCVACNVTADCSSAGAPRCHDNACVACTSNDDCAHLTDKSVCDGGTCVQCTVSDESACGLNSCDPAKNRCTETARGSVGNCEACLADSECVGGDQADPDVRCVPMNFQGTARDGGFCLRRATKTCTQPYKVPITAQSLSGADAESYCGIEQTLTRCEAVLDLVNSRACPDGLDTSCGCQRDGDGACTGAGAGGLCKTVGVDANQCTYPCAVANQCPTAFSCDVPATAYCQHS